MRTWLAAVGDPVRRDEVQEEWLSDWLARYPPVRSEPCFTREETQLAELHTQLLIEEATVGVRLPGGARRTIQRRARMGWTPERIGAEMGIPLVRVAETLGEVPRD